MLIILCLIMAVIAIILFIRSRVSEDYDDLLILFSVCCVTVQFVVVPIIFIYFGDYMSGTQEKNIEEFSLQQIELEENLQVEMAKDHPDSLKMKLMLEEINDINDKIKKEESSLSARKLSIFV